MQLQAEILLIKSSFSLLYDLNGGWKFMEFIYFISFSISVNLPDQLVTDMSEPVLKS